MQQDKMIVENRRILRLDGGGLRGTFPAAFLAEMETHLPHPIGSYFDLIAGTSVLRKGRVDG